MFPEETLHCVEWARDNFEKLFCITAKSVKQIVDDVASNTYVPQGESDIF